MPIVTDYTALISGSNWTGIEVTNTPVIVTYSFPTTAAAYLTPTDGFYPATVASFQAFSAAEQQQARDALGIWAAASGLIFLEVAPGQGDLNFQLVDFSTTAGQPVDYSAAAGIGFFPFGGWTGFSYPNYTTSLDLSGDVFMNTVYENPGDTVDMGVLLHEIGHAIGLKHPTEVFINYAANPAVTHDEVLATDDPNITIMAQSGGGLSTDIGQIDRDAAAYLYGAAGTGGVYTGNAAGANSVVSAWSYDVALARVTQAGFATADTIRGTSIIDLISGLDGDDRLFGLAGSDTLYGGNGNDELFGGQGTNTLVGGADDDTYYVESSTDILVESLNAGFDSVFAFASFNLGGNLEYLQLFGSGLTGRGNSGDNVIFGDGTFATILYGKAGNDYMGGGDGNDTIFGGGNVDTIFGGEGDDTINGDAGNDFLYGEGGNDTLVGSADTDVLYGGTGNDKLQSDGGDDTMNGEAGNDIFFFKAAGGGSGFDAVFGGADFDTIRGFVAGAVIGLSGFSGIERIDAGGFANVTLSGSPNGNLFNFAAVTMVGITRINLAGGNDIAIGSATADVFDGGAGLDTISGGGGNDNLTGFNDADTLTGDAGADTFNYDSAFQSRFGIDADTITDFTPGTDKLDLFDIDANTILGGGQAFTYIGAAAFSGAAGELRYDTVLLPGQTMILADVNGGGVADLAIILSNGAVPFAGDYIL